MDNTTIEVIKIGASLLGGGAIGAIINASVTSYRNRIQPIGKATRIETVFSNRNFFKNHLTKITFSGTTENFHFDNLYIVQIPILNEGNKDYSEFNFGITLPESVTAVNLKLKGKDRHHLIEAEQNIDFDSPSNTIDFKLKPFNRKDLYHITLFVTCVNNNILEGISFSSNMPVRFKDIAIIPEKKIILKILNEIIMRS
jgi:hypothetical protein